MRWPRRWSTASGGSVDATKLAPRQSLLRVATGRDAADTAFLTNFGAGTTLTGLEVTAVVDRFELDDTQPADPAALSISGRRPRPGTARPPPCDLAHS